MLQELLGKLEFITAKILSTVEDVSIDTIRQLRTILEERRGRQATIGRKFY